MSLPPISDAEAAEAARAAFVQLRGYYEPSAPELLSVLAVARHETGFGRLGQFGRNDSHNWGAIICARGAQHADESHCFQGAMQGKGAQRWRRYASDVDGAADLIRELERRPLVRAAMALGEPYALAEAMRQSSYFIADTSTAYGAALDRHMRELRKVVGGGAPPHAEPSDAEQWAALLLGLGWLTRRIWGKK